MKRFSIIYKGSLFYDDTDGWNSHDCDDFVYLARIYDEYADEENGMYIMDNIAGVAICGGGIWL